MHAIIFLALQLVAQDPATAAARQARDSAVWARADTAIQTFLWEWRDAWQTTERTRYPGLIDMRDRSISTGPTRLIAAHCHWTSDTPIRLRSHIIRGAVVAHASCPIWFPEIDGKIEDERLAIDNGIQRGERLPIAMQRGQLRALLDSLAQQLPGDARLTGQRVRFDLDAGAFRDAWAAATSCVGTDPWCQLLQGLVLHRAGYAAEADSAFLVALSGMPEAERCRWSNVGMLLEPGERKAYEALPCASRAEFQARLWWLADPLWLERGNERRAEDFARKVTIALLGPRGDLRNRLQPGKGGEAVAETLVRYGWPTHAYWAGLELDVSHGQWLRMYAADTAAPYLVREYTRDRLHTIPDSAILASPFSVQPGEWQINPPPNDHDWWPVEHFARDGGAIVLLPAGQTAMLRRRAATRFAWAGDLGSGLLARHQADTIRAALLETQSPALVRTVGTFSGRIGRPLVVHAPLPPGRTLIGVELPGDTAHPAARARFGVDIAETLPSEGRVRAVSQPLLYDPLGTGERLLGADSALARMYGTTEFPRFMQLGVYWEGYGFGAGDTVDVELQLVRKERSGLLARIGIVGRGDRKLGMHWRDAPGSVRARQTADGAVPIQMRNVVLDVSRLSPGRYGLVVSMNGVRSAPRAIELR